MAFIKYSLFICLITVSLTVRAKSEGEPKAEGGEGKSAESMGRNEKEFIEKTAKLNTLTNRLADADKRFKELIVKKDKAKGNKEKQAVIQEMVELTNQRNKDVEAYNKIRTELSLRYPSQGKQLDRRYHIQNKRSLEEMEGVAGLDEMLTRIRKQVDRKFAPFKEEEDKQNGAAPTVAAPAEEKPKRLRLEK